MNLIHSVDHIDSQTSLVNFIQALIQDYSHDPSAWEHTSIDSYLEALAAWVADMEGYYERHGLTMPQEPTWHIVGQMLLAAKSYE